MKSMLVKIASFAVMFHMTFGCSLHHGFGGSACAGQHTKECCQNHESKDRDSDHGNHGADACRNHDHGQPPQPLLSINDDCQSPGHRHCACDEDGCSFTKSVKFDLSLWDISADYLGGAENSAVAGIQFRSGHNVDPFPDYAQTNLPVRAHLLFGVQIL